MKETEIYFCGLSKNNLDSLTQNIAYILNFKKKSKYKKINVLMVDSNSVDGSGLISEINLQEHMVNFLM